jgi:hypothetical protein
MTTTTTARKSKRARKPTASRRPYTIYVIKLKRNVLSNKKFMARNASYVDGKPCVYVGMTYLTCEERLAQHKAGIHSARIVYKFGKSCMKTLCRRTKAMSQRHALKREARLAATLCEKGWGVWSN